MARQHQSSKTRAPRRTRTPDEVRLRLPYLPPYDWQSLLAFLDARSIPGVESVDQGVYRRSIEVDGVPAGLEVGLASDPDFLQLRVLATVPLDVAIVVEWVRHLFDLECDPCQISAHLGKQEPLKTLVRKRPGLRLPGAWNPFEVSVRAILGQQVSVRAASTLAGRIVTAFGSDSAAPLPGVTHTFPGPDRLAEADLCDIGLPVARRQTIRNLANAVSTGALYLDGSRDLDETFKLLRAIPGIGEWTSQYIAMRALGEPDAFPIGDLGLIKALTINGKRPSSPEILLKAEAWRPFRAYAVMHLWRSLG